SPRRACTVPAFVPLPRSCTSTNWPLVLRILPFRYPDRVLPRFRVVRLVISGMWSSFRRWRADPRKSTPNQIGPARQVSTQVELRVVERVRRVLDDQLQLKLVGGGSIGLRLDLAASSVDHRRDRVDE